VRIEVRTNPLVLTHVKTGLKNWPSPFFKKKNPENQMSSLIEHRSTSQAA
jgi:hypothetical protein